MRSEIPWLNWRDLLEWQAGRTPVPRQDRGVARKGEFVKGVPLTPDPARAPLRGHKPERGTAAVLISTTEAAKRLGLSPNTLRSYVASGLISCRRVGPKLLKFDADEIERFAQTVSNA